MSHIYAKEEEHTQLSGAYQSKRDIHICKEVFGRHYQARGAYQEPSGATYRVIGSTDSPSGAIGSTDSLWGAIGSNRQSYWEHRQSYREPLGAIDRVIGSADRVIGSYREVEHRQSYREPLGA